MARGIDEYAAHRTGREREKVAGVGPVDVRAHQTQVCLVDEGGGVERRGAFTPTSSPGQLSKALVEQLEQLVLGLVAP